MLLVFLKKYRYKAINCTNKKRKEKSFRFFVYLVFYKLLPFLFTHFSIFVACTACATVASANVNAVFTASKAVFVITAGFYVTVNFVSTTIIHYISPFSEVCSQSLLFAKFKENMRNKKNILLF